MREFRCLGVKIASRCSGICVSEMSRSKVFVPASGGELNQRAANEQILTLFCPGFSSVVPLQNRKERSNGGE
jgi:hypothetical protein